MAGGFRRSEHSSAEDEERGLVVRVPCASSRLTEGAWWNLDFSLDWLSGTWNQTTPLTAHIHQSFQIVSVPRAGVGPLQTLSQQSGRPIKAERPVYAELLPPDSQASAEPKEPSGSLRVRLFVLHDREGGEKSLLGRFLPRWD